jgi:hypothetical protein
MTYLDLNLKFVHDKIFIFSDWPGIKRPFLYMGINLKNRIKMRSDQNLRCIEKIMLNKHIWIFKGHIQMVVGVKSKIYAVFNHELLDKFVFIYLQYDTYILLT